MKKLSMMMAAALGIATVAMPGVASAQPWQSIDQRQRNIDARIDQGIRTGALSRAEAGRLRAQFRDLARLEARYRQSGGRLDNRERRDLNQRFDRLSARVRIQKHDWNRR